MTHSSDELLIGVFVKRGGSARATSDVSTAYLFLVDKRVTNTLPQVDTL